MIYLVSRFFRQPTNVPRTDNKTLPVVSSQHGNLYKSGDLLVRIDFIFQIEINRWAVGCVYIH